MTENNNRQLALDFATANAVAGSTPEQITAAAAAYLTFLDAGTVPATPAAAPAPAPRTGQEIIDLIETKRSVFGNVVTDAVKTRASVLRTEPLDRAIVTALAALSSDGNRLYGRDVVNALTYSIGRLRTYTPAPRAAATTGQAIVDLIESHRGEYGQYADELLTAAGRAGFRTMPIADAKRTATSTLLARFDYRFPTETRALVAQIQAL